MENGMEWNGNIMEKNTTNQVETKFDEMEWKNEMNYDIVKCF